MNSSPLSSSYTPQRAPFFPRPAPHFGKTELVFFHFRFSLKQLSTVFRCRYPLSSFFSIYFSFTYTLISDCFFAFLFFSICSFLLTRFIRSPFATFPFHFFWLFLYTSVQKTIHKLSLKFVSF